MEKKEIQCCSHKAHHNDEVKKKLTDRIKKIAGQVKAINRMIDEDVYCDNVLNQILSVQKALNGVAKQLMSEHIKSCVTEQLIAGNKNVVDELLNTLNKMMH